MATRCCSVISLLTSGYVVEICSLSVFRFTLDKQDVRSVMPAGNFTVWSMAFLQMVSGYQINGIFSIIMSKPVFRVYSSKMNW